MNANLLSICNSCRKVKGLLQKSEGATFPEKRICKQKEPRYNALHGNSFAPFRHVLEKWIYCNSLRRVIAHQTKKAGGDIPPS